MIFLQHEMFGFNFSFWLKKLFFHVELNICEFEQQCAISLHQEYCSSTQGTYFAKVTRSILQRRDSSSSSSQMYLSYLQKESESSVLRLFPQFYTLASEAAALATQLSVLSQKAIPKFLEKEEEEAFRPKAFYVFCTFFPRCFVELC